MPVIAVNALADNKPLSVGKPLPGIETRIGDDSELLVRGPDVMLRYWRLDETIVDGDGWLHTGDQVRMDIGGRIYITGRIKEVELERIGYRLKEFPGYAKVYRVHIAPDPEDSAYADTGAIRYGA